MKYKWLYYGAAFLVWLAYSAATFSPGSLADTAQKYHLPMFGVILIFASIELPFLICWLFGTAGWLYFRAYVHTMPDNTAHRRGYRLVLAGLAILVLGLIVPSIISTLYARFVDAQPGPIRTWISTYTGIIFPLIGFFVASLGSRRLLESLKLKAEPWLKSPTAVVPIVVFAAFYLGLIFTNPGRQLPTAPGLTATYYLPDILIILTIVLPVVATWAFGFRMVLNLEHYSHYVAPDHKPALANIYNGVLVIIGSIILQQVIASLGSSRLTGLNLGLILIIIYLLLIIIAVGYGLIARSARQLVTSQVPE